MPFVEFESLADEIMLFYCKTIYSRIGRLSWENYLGRLEHGGWDCQMTSILEVYEEDTPNEPNAGRNGADAESTIL